MAFEDYGSVPEHQLKRAKEIYEEQQSGGNDGKKYEERPEKFKPLKDKAVKTKKYGLTQKFSDIFFVNDPAVARENVFREVFVPQVKDLFMNMLWGYFSSFLYDSPMPMPGRGRRSMADIYNRASDRGMGTITREKSGARRGGVDLSSGRRMTDDLIFDDIAEATEYLDIFRDYIERYGVLSIGDVYDTCGLSHSYTDDKYGWKSLAGANVRRLGHGQYTIYFPKAEPL